MRSPPRAHILIVDDSRETRDIYADYLSYFGYGVAGVSRAREALDIVQTLPPDVVVIDLRGRDVRLTEDVADAPRKTHPHHRRLGRRARGVRRLLCVRKLLERDGRAR